MYLGWYPIYLAYIYIYIYIFNIYTYIFIYIYTHMYTYIYLINRMGWDDIPKQFLHQVIE